MLRNIIGGIAVGIANIIPGVSGGTMMVILGIFDKMMEVISEFFKKGNTRRKEQLLFLAQVLLGAAIGLIGFAKVLEFLFNHYPTQTLYWFIGLVAFSIPVFLKQQLKGERVSWLWMVIGMALILLIQLLAPAEENNVNPDFPAVSLFLCGQMVLVGMIGGFSMFLPGVSGSMVLLIIGQYYLFKSYLANVMRFSLEILIPLFFMGIGILLGILLAAKILNKALKANENATLSFLLGLIVASTCVLFYQTWGAAYDVGMVITCVLSLLFGGVIVMLINRFA